MKKAQFLALLLLPAALLFSRCQQEAYSIKGNIQNAANLQVVLEQAFFQGQPTALGRATCDGSGTFKIEQKEGLKAGIYRLSVGAKRMFFMLDGAEKGLSIAADLNTMDKLTGVSFIGSTAATCYAERVQELFNAGAALTPDGLKTIVDKGCTPLIRAVLSAQLFNAPEAHAKYGADFKKYSEELNASLPTSKYATDFTGLVAQFEKAATAQQQQPDGGGGGAASAIAVGQPAPEISLPDPSGKTRSLSALKGKVVLLDFWASWCGPCRRENPNVVAVYKKYKDKGFDIFSVSLDGVDTRRMNDSDQTAIANAEKNGREAWKQAISADNLLWDNHVSDLRKWSSAPAATYGVQSIPKTFLIDRQGKIAVIETRGRLEAELLKLL